MRRIRSASLTEFWAAALEYEPEPGYDHPDSASIIDPQGIGPAVGWLRVPEGKQAKNRPHDSTSASPVTDRGISSNADD